MSDHIYIIAEMAYSHDGSADLARDIVEKAAAGGADAISIHITHMPDYMARHYGSGAGRVSAGKDTQPVYDYLVEISLSFEDWRGVADAAREKGLDLIVMPNDMASLDFAETLEPDAYVLSAACFEEYTFIEKVAGLGRHIYLRAGGATLGEMEMVINLIKSAGNEQMTLLYGHQNYPTGIEDLNLNLLSSLMATFGLPVGVADHTDADDDFALVAPILALPLGITCIEKHLTHDRSQKGEDFESALNADEFALMVERVRKAEKAFGRRFAIGLDESSQAYRKIVRKRLVATRDINAGEKLTAADIAAKRADEGESPTQINFFIGAVAASDIPFDAGLTMDLVESER